MHKFVLCTSSTKVLLVQSTKVLLVQSTYATLINNGPSVRRFAVLPLEHGKSHHYLRGRGPVRDSEWTLVCARIQNLSFIVCNISTLLLLHAVTPSSSTLHSSNLCHVRQSQSSSLLSIFLSVYRLTTRLK